MKNKFFKKILFYKLKHQIINLKIKNNKFLNKNKKLNKKNFKFQNYKIKFKNLKLL